MWWILKYICYFNQYSNTCYSLLKLIFFMVDNVIIIFVKIVYVPQVGLGPVTLLRGIKLLLC